MSPWCYYKNSRNQHNDKVQNYIAHVICTRERPETSHQHIPTCSDKLEVRSMDEIMRFRRNLKITLKYIIKNLSIWGCSRYVQTSFFRADSCWRVFPSMPHSATTCALLKKSGFSYVWHVMLVKFGQIRPIGATEKLVKFAHWSTLKSLKTRHIGSKTS